MFNEHAALVKCRRPKNQMQNQPILPVATVAAIISLLAAHLACSEPFYKGRAVAPLTAKFEPGDYVWRPEASPTGPVVIVVSLPEQVMSIYRNGVRIGRSTISTGKAGHPTPTGVFTILQKNVEHTSTIFKSASMPYMERLTWAGVAMHAGDLPGYPASHGCVRLPLDFARKLYTVTSNGTTVLITDRRSTHGSTAAPGLLFAGRTGRVPLSGVSVWQPGRAPAGAVSIIVSSADAAAYVYRSGVEIGRAPVGGLRAFKGSYVFSALNSVDSKGRRDWLSTAKAGGRAPNLKDLSKRAIVDPQFLGNLRGLITPGTTLILTAAPVNVSTRSASGFNILTTAEKL